MDRITRGTATLLVALVASTVLAPVTLADGRRAPHDLSAPRPMIRVIDAATLPPAGFLVGIDVSHWQGSVDWPTVHAAGVGFAYLKATEGTTFVDDAFAVNRANAAASGIPLGAYHFARPSATPGDATAEADHFLDVATPAPGDLVPALDLEDDGGLAPDALTVWTLQFVARVRERLGVAPAVYVSPAFWTTSLDDAIVVAGWGSPLWIAHWQAASPRIPANGWQGRGWTLWQWSTRGLVTGIPGEVDLDVLAGRDLTSIRLP